MRFVAWMLLIGIIPHDDVPIDHVDLIEINHFYDGCGKLVFTQQIFWDWCPPRCRFEVRAWRMHKSDWQNPRWDWERNDAFSIWQDGDTLREVRAKATRTSYLQFDPELYEREITPKELRRELVERDYWPADKRRGVNR